MNRIAIHEIDRHTQQLTHQYLSAHHLNQRLQQALFKPLLAEPPMTITTELRTAATLIWECAWDRLEPTAPTATSLTELNQQLQHLCVTWATRKYQQPQDNLFQADFTTGGIKAMWQHPEVCAAINTVAVHASQNAAFQTRMYQYPTCWAYVFGCLIYQLLQWNHSLTSYQLRELFEKSPDCSTAPPKSYPNTQLQQPQTLSQSHRLKQAA